MFYLSKLIGQTIDTLIGSFKEGALGSKFLKNLAVGVIGALMLLFAFARIYNHLQFTN